MAYDSLGHFLVSLFVHRSEINYVFMYHHPMSQAIKHFLNQECVSIHDN